MCGRVHIAFQDHIHCTCINSVRAQGFVLKLYAATPKNGEAGKLNPWKIIVGQGNTHELPGNSSLM